MRTSVTTIASSALLVFALGCGTAHQDTNNTDAGFVDGPGDGAVGDGPEGDASDGNPDDDASQADTTAPTIVSVSPADNSQGMPANATIEITFSEPMDTASVESAWLSEQLPATKLTFNWDSQNTRLIAVPLSDLPLAEGIGLIPTSVDTITIAMILENTATDVAGNSLGADFEFRFDTIRRMTVDLVLIEDLTRGMRDDGAVFTPNATAIAPGDDTGNRQSKAFMGFTTPVFPIGAEIESATLNARQTSTTGSPFGLGAIHAFHITSAIIGLSSFSSALADIGEFSTNSTPGDVTMDVTTEFVDDLTNRVARGDRTQYRLEFPAATNSDNTADQMRFSRSSMALAVTYLVE